MDVMSAIAISENDSDGTRATVPDTTATRRARTIITFWNILLTRTNNAIEACGDDIDDMSQEP